MPSLRPFVHRLIQRNYIGPGNAIDSAETIDKPDEVAREHDLLYQAIEESGVSLDKVNSADTGSAVEFLQSASESDSISSALIGAASGLLLTGKATAEKYVVGKPVYPKMAPPTSRSHKRKLTTENPLDQTGGRVHRIHGFHAANLRRSEDKMKRLVASGAPKEAIAAQKNIIDKMKDDHQKFKDASAYHSETAAHLNLMNELVDIQPVLETPPDSRNEGEIGDDALGGAGFGGVVELHDLEINDPKRMRAEAQADPFNLLNHDSEYYKNQVMEMEQNISDNVASYDAVNQSDVEMLESNQKYLSDLGLADNMANVQQVIRSQGARFEDGHIVAKYSRLFYTWGYNWKALDIADNNTNTIKQKWICTPLAYVPVDYVPFYIPPSVYNELPQEADIVEVDCKVTPWGSRVSFQTNADTTSPATAQHVVVGASAIGLNMDPSFNFANRDVLESTTMIIATHSPVDTDKFKKKLWGVNDSATMYSDVPSTFGAIRQLDVYGGPVVDNYVAASAGIPAVAEYKPTGWPDFETKINRFAFDAFKGQPIINYNYKPKFGMLKSKTRRWQSNRSDVGNQAYDVHGLEVNRCVNIDSYPRTADAAGNQTGSNTTLTAASVAARDVSIAATSQVYDSLVDVDHCKFYAGDIGKLISPQPQLHVGILPVQANQPGVSAGFVCAAAYWQIDTMIKIKVNFGSSFNLVVARPIDHMVGYYNDGFDDLTALQGTVRGRIPYKKPYE